MNNPLFLFHLAQESYAIMQFIFERGTKQMIMAVLIVITGLTIGVISALLVIKGLSAIVSWLSKDNK